MSTRVINPHFRQVETEFCSEKKGGELWLQKKKKPRGIFAWKWIKAEFFTIKQSTRLEYYLFFTGYIII